MKLSPLITMVSLCAMLTVACSTDEALSNATPSAGRPNVVLLLADTLRADVLSFYGAEEERAPFLAALAGRGTVFQNAYSTSSWTAPSSASVLTGVYPDRHGVIAGFLAQFKDVGDQVDESALGEMNLLSIARDVPTLAERMQSLGYDTYGLSSNLNVGPELEFDRGFDHFRRSEGSVPAGKMFQMLREWKQLMEASEDPYFVYLHLNDVHVPYDLRPRFYTDDPTRDEVAESYEAYKSELGFLDFIIRSMHTEFGWTEDTLFVFVADHGEEFRDHGGLYHEFSVYNEVSRIPFMVSGPGLGVQAGVVEQNASLIDVAPTILGLLGQEFGDQFDGSSLAPFCLATDKSSVSQTAEALLERPLIVHRYELGEHLWSIIRERWKLIESKEETLLFDLREDPGETTDLAGQHPRLVEQLQASLKAHRERGSNPDSVQKDVEIDPGLLQQLKALGYVR
ncbi:MAG: arylsulfatase A-like enzyme [Planctomycetota bacterium]|jgi:arylsulfatase A-like enzyme